MPPNTVTGATAAYAIGIGRASVPPDNHMAVESGLVAGLLRSTPLDYGGPIWMTFRDPTQLRVSCTRTVDAVSCSVIGCR